MVWVSPFSSPLYKGSGVGPNSLSATSTAVPKAVFIRLHVEQHMSEVIRVAVYALLYMRTTYQLVILVITNLSTL